MSFGRHTRNSGWRSNQHWVECDRCGFDFRVEDVTTDWQGLVVCKRHCLESRHPQDFVRGVKDDTSPVGPTRPTAPQESNPCSTLAAVAGIAIAGCAVAGNGLEYYVPAGTFTTPT